MKSWFRRAAAMACFVAATATAALADNYPSKPITIIVPASPGGVTDMLGRLLAQHFIADSGAQVVVENKPGANNQVAAEYVTHQPGDGYTLLIGPETTFIVNPTLYFHLPYDPVEGFTPISGLVQIDHALILNPAVPANNVKELIALDKAKPGQLNYGTYGVGSSGHLATTLFSEVTGVTLQHVPYTSFSQAVTDVSTGRISLWISTVGGTIGHIQGGKLHALAVSGPTRAAQLPDVPTFDELGVAYGTDTSWYGLFAPAGTPRAIIDKINADTAKVFETADMKERATQLGFRLVGGSPEKLGDYLKSEITKWADVAKKGELVPN